MHTRVGRRYLFVPLVYVGVILLLLFLQFSGTTSVSFSIRELSFTGVVDEQQEQTPRSEITAAEVSFQGLLFDFGTEETAILRTASGETVSLVPYRYNLNGQSIDLFLRVSDGSEGSLGGAAGEARPLATVQYRITGDEEDELLITAQLNTLEGTEEVVSLELPFAVSDRVERVSPEGAPEGTLALAVNEETTYFVSLPERAAVESERIVLPAGFGAQTVRYSLFTEERFDLVSTVFATLDRAVPEDQYTDELDSYFDQAYRDWGNRRFNGGTGTWLMRGASPRFSEEILTAYLAEAWRRNEYTVAFNQMRRAADLHPEEVGLLSAAFLGDLREVTPRFLEAGRRTAAEIEEQVVNRDPTLFQRDDLIAFTALRGSEELFRSTLEFASYVDFQQVSMADAIGMLSNYVDVDHLTPESEEIMARFRPIIEERIYPAMIQTDRGFFVETSPGEVNVELSIKAGHLLNLQGEREEDARMVMIGRNLVLSGVQLTDQFGFLPETLFISGQAIQSSTGSFGPERIYSVLRDNPNYPRMISLYDELGAGSFIWTIVDFDEIDITEDRYRFALSYPRNRTHYLIFQGIPQFDSMNLFGRLWRNDPFFEAYIKGRHYESDTDTLMIKYTDNSVEEEIILNYGE
ncbi:MAG: hypothetical protein ACLFP6_08125 [Spirochaetaceae bacterium]